MKTTILIIAVFLWLFDCAAAGQQRQKIDSLLKVYQGKEDGISKAADLNALAFELTKLNPDSAYKFGIECLELATRINYKMGIANVQVTLSTLDMNSQKYEQASKRALAAIKQYDELKAVTSQKSEDYRKIVAFTAIAYGNLGVIAFYLGDLNESMRNQKIALNLRKEVNSRSGLAESYYSIGYLYLSKSDYSEARKYLFHALKSFNELRNIGTVADVYTMIGNSYMAQGNATESLKNQLAALRIRKQVNDKKGVATAYNNIGNANLLMGNYPEALKYFYLALKINIELQSESGIVSSSGNIGNIYYELGDYDEALKYFFGILKLQLRMSNILEKANLAVTYDNIGNIYRKQGKYTEALRILYNCYKIYTQIENRKGLGFYYMNVGMVHENQQNYQEALKNLFNAYNLLNEIEDKEYLSTFYQYTGKIYLTQEKYDLASLNLEKGLALAKEIGHKQNIKESYGSLAKLDSARGNYKQAYDNYKAFTAYRDSLYNESNTKKMVQTHMQYQIDQKQAEQDKKDEVVRNKLQQQKIVRNTLIGGFFIVLIFAGVFLSQRNKISAGKKRSDELLLNILPSEVAEELKLNGTSVAKQFDDVTVLFTDFKNFSQISERLTPSELVQEINICYRAFDMIMGKYNIEKIKTIGDSYMAAGGLPVVNKTNAVNVVEAGLEILQFMGEHNEKKAAEGKEVFGIRLGIHTGPVVAGIVGIKKFAYDIWGDTVNIASRMESSGEAGKVNISQSTYEIVKEKYNCVYRGKIDAKNKGVIDMYFVDGAV